MDVPPRLVVCEHCHCHIRAHERRCPLCREAVDGPNALHVVGVALAMMLPGCRLPETIAPAVPDPPPPPWSSVAIEPEYGVAAVDPPPFEFDVAYGAEATATAECASGLCRPVRWRFPRQWFP